MQNGTRKIRLLPALSLIGCIAFYLIFAVIDGPVWCVDSESYVTMDLSRPPLYPLWLLFFRTVFGSDPLLYDQPCYLFCSILGAAVLNGYAAWRIGFVVEKQLRQAARPFPRLLGTAAVLLQLAVSLLNRFAAKRSSMYAESILSESLAMPLYILFCIDLWLWMRYDRKRHLAAVGICIFLMLSLRSQMLVAPALVICMSLLHDVLGKNRRFRRFLAALLVCASAYLLSAAGECAYNYLLHGAAIRHTFGNKAFYCTAMYTATRADADLFDPDTNADERTLFLKILDNCEREELPISYAPENADWITLADHFSWSYDDIGFDATLNTVDDYIDARLAICNGAAPGEYTGCGVDLTPYLSADENGTLILTEPMHALVYDRIIGIINAALRRRMPPISPVTLGANLLDGLMNSVARTMPQLQLYTVIIYAVYLLLYLLVIRKHDLPVVLAAEIVLGGMLINVAAVSLIMFAQSRYMIYSMGLFYEMLLIMTVAVLPERKKK
ncbi:MAG: hypothetical protein K6G16_07780 [Lachnospiraceae bacterium]|nr:hypothetical protein [Lachnospiraceae bacterium]